MRKNLKKILCGLLVIAPVALATTTLASCGNNGVKVASHKIALENETVYENSEVKNFDVIEFKNLSDSSNVTVNIWAQYKNIEDGKQVDKQVELHTTVSRSNSQAVNVGLHIADLHLAENSTAKLHETVSVDDAIVNTQEIEVMLHKQDPWTPTSFVSFDIEKNISGVSGQEIIIGNIYSKSPVVYNDDVSFVLDSGKVLHNLKISDTEVIFNSQAHNFDEKLVGYVHVTTKTGGSYDSDSFNLFISKAPISISFNVDPQIAQSHKAGDLVKLGMIKIFNSSQDDKIDLTFVSNDSEKSFEVVRDNYDVLTLQTEKLAEASTLVGKLSVQINGILSFESEEITINLTKSDTEVSFEALADIKGQAGEQITLGKFTATWGTLKDISAAKFTSKDANKTCDVIIDEDGNATIKTDKSETNLSLVGTLSAKIETSRSFESKEITINLTKSDTEVSFEALADIKGQAGEQITLGKFTATYGTLKDISAAKFTSKDANKTCDVIIDEAGNATIKTDKSETNLSLVGTLSAKIETSRSFESKEITINLTKSDTEVSFEALADIKGQAGEQITLGKFTATYGTLKDISDAKFTSKDANKTFDVIIDEAGNATISTDKSETNLSLAGTLSAQIEKSGSFESEEITINLTKSDTEVSFEALADIKGQAGEQITLGKFTATYGTLKDISDAKFISKDSNETFGVIIDEAGNATITTDKSETNLSLVGTLSAQIEKSGSFKSEEITINLTKSDTEVSFKALLDIGGQAGEQITLGKFTATWGTLKDISAAKFTSKDSNKTYDVIIDEAGNATITTDKSDEDLSLVGTLSAQIEKSGSFQSEEMTIYLTKSDIEIAVINQKNA